MVVLLKFTLAVILLLMLWHINVLCAIWWGVKLSISNTMTHFSTGGWIMVWLAAGKGTAYKSVDTAGSLTIHSNIFMQWQYIDFWGNVQKCAGQPQCPYSYSHFNYQGRAITILINKNYIVQCLENTDYLKYLINFLLEFSCWNMSTQSRQIASSWARG